MTVHSTINPRTLGASLTLIGLHALQDLRRLDIRSSLRPIRSRRRDPNPGGSGSSVVRIQLTHIEVALSISARSAVLSHGRKACTRRKGELAEDQRLADPVIQRLLRELDSAAQSSEPDGAYADAIGLALVARWLHLNSIETPVNDSQLAASELPKWRLNRVTAYVENHISYTDNT